MTLNGIHHEISKKNCAHFGHFCKKYPVQNLVWREIESVSVKVTVVDELEPALLNPHMCIPLMLFYHKHDPQATSVYHVWQVVIKQKLQYPKITVESLDDNAAIH